MIYSDVTFIARAMNEWKEKLGKCEKIAIHSPSELDFVMLLTMFPQSEISIYTIDSWNLNDRCRDGKRYDLLFCANTFMASPDVDLWFENISEVADKIVIQDLILAWRNGNSELSPETGDIRRFCFLPEYKARVNDAYDLRRLGDRLEAIKFYPGNSGYRTSDNREMEGLKFIALIKKHNETKKKQSTTSSKAPVVVSNHDDTQGVDVPEPGAS